MTLQVIGLCWFSYPAIGGLQVDHDTIEERFALFEAVALPSLRAQTDPNFDLIIVVGDQLPRVIALRQVVQVCPKVVNQVLLCQT